MSLKRCFLLLFPTLFFISTANSQSSFVKDSLDAYLSRVMSDWKIPGMAVCIVKDNKVILAKGYGVCDLQSKKPVNEETLFMIASNSKAFTGTSLALLDYEKRLSLDDKIVKYMPWFHLYEETSTKDVTIRDMLCHRIGLKTFQGDFLNWGSNLSRKELMEKMKVHKPAYPFRYQYGYCNAAYLTAGEIIPLVTDTSWDDFLKFRFFNPLQMNRTSTTYDKIVNDKNTAKPYTLVNGELTLLDFVNVDNLGPAASINSCVKDLANWMLFQLDSGRFQGTRLIPFNVLQQTRIPQTLVNQLSSLSPSTHFSAYGLGWNLSDYAGKKIISHTGGANGFVTTTCLIPEENLGITVLTNTDANYMYDGVRRQLMDAFLNQPYRDYNQILFSRFVSNEKAEKEAITALEQKAGMKNKLPLSASAFSGSYENEVYGKMEIQLVKNELEMHFSHHPTLIGKLIYLGENKFLCRFSDPTYGVKEVPFTIENGSVKNCKVKVNDFIDYMSYEFRKN